MTYNCPTAQTNPWSWIAPAIRIRVNFGGPCQSAGEVT
jgi:hypothetical protein